MAAARNRAMLGSGYRGLILHVLLSTLFAVWLVVALLVQLVTSLVLAAWSVICYVAVSALTLSNALERPLYWKWHHLDVRLDSLKFPEGFVWGVATAAHQIEGGNTNNQWYRWENTIRPHGLPPAIKNDDKSGNACEHWDRVEEDVELIKGLGVGSYRFSIEWSKVEPQEGVFDQAAIDHYHREIDLLLAAGLTPMITLLHFTHPLWLEDKGGFRSAKAPQAFLTYARHMYAEYGGKVTMWCTINEPEVCTANGYVVGVFPPGKFLALQASGEVLLNLLKAHVEVYYALHEDAAAAQRRVEVGIVKDLFQFHPYKWYNVLDHLFAKLMDSLFNKVIIEFLRTGKYRWWVPLVSSVRYTDARAPKANDFIGLNYYSHYYASVWNLIFEPETEEKLLSRPGDTMTDMPHCLYPEGLYSALQTMCGLGHPVYVTENGIADRDDTRRRLYLQRYLYAMSRAIEDGCDVRGYFYWSLYDNFEWCEGYQPRFGLYAVDFETQQRTLRDSARYFMDIVKMHSGAPGTGAGAFATLINASADQDRSPVDAASRAADMGPGVSSSSGSGDALTHASVAGTLPAFASVAGGKTITRKAADQGGVYHEIVRRKGSAVSDADGDQPGEFDLGVDAGSAAAAVVGAGRGLVDERKEEDHVQKHKGISDGVAIV